MMIRSRLVGSLRRQDWTAVVIELVTVMLGLFLGLQLNDWNDARQARAREKAALERLHEESEAIVDYCHRTIARFDRLNADQEAAIVALSTGDRAKFNTHELAEHIGSLTFYPGIAPPRATYDELSGSGLLNEIGSTSVRTAVARYYSQLTWIQSQLDYFRQANASFAAAPHPGQTTDYDPKAPTLKGRFVRSADFTVIAADRVYMTQLVDELRNQMVFQSYRQGLGRAAEAMCKSLAAALHETCAAAGSSVSPTGEARAR
jgi:hypothetical protein